MSSDVNLLVTDPRKTRCGRAGWRARCMTGKPCACAVRPALISLATVLRRALLWSAVVACGCWPDPWVQNCLSSSCRQLLDGYGARTGLGVVIGLAVGGSLACVCVRINASYACEIYYCSNGAGSQNIIQHRQNLFQALDPEDKTPARLLPPECHRPPCCQLLHALRHSSMVAEAVLNTAQTVRLRGGRCRAAACDKMRVNAREALPSCSIKEKP